VYRASIENEVGWPAFAKGSSRAKHEVDCESVGLEDCKVLGGVKNSEMWVQNYNKFDMKLSSSMAELSLIRERLRPYPCRLRRRRLSIPSDVSPRGPS
jgi:hypothetical protein